jgi:hypothetical protein
MQKRRLLAMENAVNVIEVLYTNWKTLEKKTEIMQTDLFT